MTYISSSSPKNMSELPVTSENRFFPKLRQRATEINTTPKQYPPLLIVSFDLDNTLIKEINDLEDKKSSLENYKNIYPSKDFILAIYNSLNHIANKGVPILPLLVTSSTLSRAVPIVKYSSLKMLFPEDKQIYARGTFSLKDKDKQSAKCLERHDVLKESSKLEILIIAEANNIFKTLNNFFSDMIYYPLILYQ